jgi:hypothetical protein
MNKKDIYTTGKYCAVALLKIVEMVALHEQNL